MSVSSTASGCVLWRSRQVMGCGYSAFSCVAAAVCTRSVGLKLAGKLRRHLLAAQDEGHCLSADRIFQ